MRAPRPVGNSSATRGCGENADRQWSCDAVMSVRWRTLCPARSAASDADPMRLAGDACSSVAGAFAMICCNGRAEWPSGRVTFVLKSVVPASDPERLHRPLGEGTEQNGRAHRRSRPRRGAPRRRTRPTPRPPRVASRRQWICGHASSIAAISPLSGQQSLCKSASSASCWRATSIAAP